MYSACRELFVERSFLKRLSVANPPFVIRHSLKPNAPTCPRVEGHGLQFRHCYPPLKTAYAKILIAISNWLN
ncbi:hypothetical protein D1AOALGA4SA_2268 [Olavius algarvensis Delta 1 endosymbiont]|nr:hypothetical protein D1AOALGA4SA_2268 [Olavius algarvensis Delta 1 endosymbiont]